MIRMPQVAQTRIMLAFGRWERAATAYTKGTLQPEPAAALFKSRAASTVPHFGIALVGLSRLALRTMNLCLNALKVT